VVDRRDNDGRWSACRSGVSGSDRAVDLFGIKLKMCDHSGTGLKALILPSFTSPWHRLVWPADPIDIWR